LSALTTGQRSFAQNIRTEWLIQSKRNHLWDSNKRTGIRKNLDSLKLPEVYINHHNPVHRKAMRIQLKISWCKGSTVVRDSNQAIRNQVIRNQVIHNQDIHNQVINRGILLEVFSHIRQASRVHLECHRAALSL